MDFPPGTENIIKKQSLFEAYAVYAEESDENEGNTAPIMNSWSLVTLSSTYIKIKLNFTDPVNVSQGDSPYLLLVQLDLSQY